MMDDSRESDWGWGLGTGDWGVDWGMGKLMARLTTRQGMLDMIGIYQDHHVDYVHDGRRSCMTWVPP